MATSSKRAPTLNSKAFLRILIIFVVVSGLIAAGAFQYYQRLASTFRQESKGYLEEVSRRIGSNIDRIVADNFAVLKTMSTALEEWDTDSLDDVRQMLRKQQAHWSYENMLLLDRDGKTYDLNAELFISLDAAVRQKMLSGTASMSTTQLINNKECILFSTPLNGVELDGNEMVALAVSYAPSSFNQALSMTSFDERAYSQIISLDGAMVVRSTSPYAFKTGYNIFATIRDAVVDEGDAFAQMEADILANRTGQIGFTFGEEHLYMVYTPVSPQNWYLATFVPSSVVNENSDLLLGSTLLICAAITIAFAGLIAALALLFNRNKRRLEQIAYLDDITGGNTIQRFYQLAENALRTAGETRYALVYTNIEKFKVLNDQLGRPTCDAMLCFYNDYIAHALAPNECMGRLSADNFILLLEFSGEQAILDRFFGWHTDAERIVLRDHLAWSIPPTEFGIYVIENNTLTFPQMIDRAKLALKDLSHSLDQKLHCAFYDDEVRRQLFREKQLEDRMGKALLDGEFLVYLQPKYSLPEEKIGGAEALVRWQTPDEGMIYPDEFIPLFEKNGFIIQVDLFVFETVCRTLREWLQRGLPLVKVSVNCSRVHFRNPRFLAPYIRIATAYGIARGQIEIELTESIVLENSGRLIHIIDEIKEAGFGCSMDDFGSGYSSLNLIQTIPVDTLKLDKIFFQDADIDATRTEAVVGSIVSMAKALSMDTVAEGVERREQVEMLKRVGCDLIQGYVFARPMHISAFEALAFPEQ